VILTVPGVHECAVVAKRHLMLDQVPIAFVLPTADCAPALGARVLAACTAQLADFKHPREIRVVDALPRSTLEKIAKAELRRRLADEAAT